MVNHLMSIWVYTLDNCTDLSKIKATGTLTSRQMNRHSSTGEEKIVEKSM